MLRYLLIALTSFALASCASAVIDENQQPPDNGNCVDNDGDERGPGCAAGADCDDNDPTVFAGCPGTATLSWDAPTENEDGSTPLDDLAGYRIHYGTNAGSYTETVTIGTTTSHVISDLPAGVTYYFAVTALDTSGNESEFSNEASKTIP